MIRIDIDNTVALEKLSELGELYLSVWTCIGGYYKEFEIPQKVKFCGKNESVVGFRTMGGHMHIFSYDAFSGNNPSLAFIASDVWKEIFTDI